MDLLGGTAVYRLLYRSIVYFIHLTLDGRTHPRAEHEDMSGWCRELRYKEEWNG